MSFTNNFLCGLHESLCTGIWEPRHRLTPLEKVSFSTSAMINCLEMHRAGAALSSSLWQDRVLTSKVFCRFYVGSHSHWRRQWPSHAWKTALHNIPSHLPDLTFLSDISSSSSSMNLGRYTLDIPFRVEQSMVAYSWQFGQLTGLWRYIAHYRKKKKKVFSDQSWQTYAGRKVNY